MTNDDISDLDVSRETMDRLQVFAGLLAKWTKSINLIAPTTVTDIWNRHIVDSAQILHHAPKEWAHWVDLGSGGGLPGLVVAIMMAPEQHMTLIESDTRKSLFLKTVKRELDLNVTVMTDRIDQTSTTNADILSARALAPLIELLPFTQTHLSPNGTALFPKGRRYQEELDHALKTWQFDVKIHPSQTDPDARILQLSRIEQREH